MRCFAFFILEILAVRSIFARRVAGTVYEEANRVPIEAALIRWFDTSRHLTTYTYTDEKGRFEMEVTDDAVEMQVSCMGYTAVTLPVSAWNEKMSIRLAYSEFQVKEVVVTSKRIEERADTLVYTVAGFTQPQDRSIADVMAKMPGIEIKPNGQIEYNGTAINKFYIEGLDLMGNKYALASNNLDRKHVKAVEILKNHQPIAALRGKSFSEQAAVNLILEDNAKLHLTGSADIASGWDDGGNSWLHENRLIAMLFKSRVQDLSIYKGNNTGKDISGEVTGVSLQDRIAQTDKERSWLNPIESYASNLPQERTTFNESHLAAVNHLNRLSKNATFRTQLSYFYHNYHHTLQQYTDYQLSDNSSAVFDEEYRSRQIQHHADANLCYELNNSRLFLKNQAVVSLEWIDGENKVRSNQVEKPMNDDNDRHYLSNHQQMTLPLAKGHTLEFLSSVSYNKMPQSLSTFTGGIQRSDYHSTNTYHYVSMMSRFLGFYFKNQLELETRSQSVDLFMAGDAIRNASSLTKLVPAWKPSFHLRRDEIYWETNFWLKYWNITSGLGNASTVLPEWNTMLRYEASPKSTFTFSYGHSQSFFDLQRLCETSYFTGYRTVSENHLTLDHTPTESVRIRYEYTNPMKGIFLSTFVQGNLMQRKSVLQSSVDENNLYVKSYVDARFHRRNINAALRISKSFGFWKSLLTGSANYLYTEDKRLSNGQLVPTYQNTLFSGITFSAKPTRKFSVDLAERLSLNALSGQRAHGLTRQWNTEADFYYKVTEQPSIGWQNQYSRYSHEGKGVLFSDFSANYTFRRFVIGLTANNIGNKQTYRQELVATDYQVISCYQLRPREWMARISVNF